MRGSLGEVAQDIRTWRGLLRGDDAVFELHCQPSVQSLKHLHGCTGAGRSIRAGQQLKAAPAVSDRVVPGDSAPVLEAQDPLQAHLLVYGAIGALGWTPQLGQ